MGLSSLFKKGNNGMTITISKEDFTKKPLKEQNYFLWCGFIDLRKKLTFLILAMIVLSIALSWHMGVVGILELAKACASVVRAF